MDAHSVCIDANPKYPAFYLMLSFRQTLPDSHLINDKLGPELSCRHIRYRH